MPKGWKNRRKTMPAKYEAGFLDELDRRTDVYKQLKATYEEIVDDCGGDEDIARTKLSMIERFVFLEACLRTWENQIATNPKESEHLLSRWIQGVNSLQGLAKTIGLKRLAKRVDLKAYVQGNGRK